MAHKPGIDEELLAEVAAQNQKKEDKRRRHAEYLRLYKAHKRATDPVQKAKEAVYQKDYTTRNLKHIVSRNKERYKANKLRAVEHMGGTCVDCGGTFHHAAFDFHHVDNRAADMVDSWLHWTWERIEAELAKCVMLCANCHRVRHYNQDKE